VLTIHNFENELELNEFLRIHLLNAYEASPSSFSLAISGGETPLPFYNYMRVNPISNSTKLLNVFWTDERFVPFDDEWSNCYMPITQWFVREKNVKCYPVNTDFTTVKESASDYANTVAKKCNSQLNYIILGMGADGHIASIFPRNEPSSELVFSCKHPSDRTERVSMNYNLLATATSAVLLIKGKRKRAVLADVSKDLPIHKLLATMDVTCLYLD
jgi:6-phosphogluconolactonase